MSEPTIGALRHRLALEAPLRLDDDIGGGTTSWALVAEVWAAVRPLSGGEIAVADGFKGRATHEITLRHRDDVTVASRLRDGVRVLELRSVRDLDGRGRWLVCLAEERLV